MPAETLEGVELPAHLRMNYRVVDEHGDELAMGRNLVELRTQFGVKAQRSFSEAAASQFERRGVMAWDF